MTIFFYKGLTGNVQIGNTLVWDLTDICRLGQVKATRFRSNVSNKMLKYDGILQNASVTAFTVSELLREKQDRVG